MFKPQMRFQKILFLSLLLLSVAVFLYAIGLCTDLYPLYLSSAYGLIKGATTYYNEIQSYNSALVKFAIVIIVGSIVPYVFSSHKRRKYYKENLIATIIQGSLFVACSIFMIINTAKYKTLFLESFDMEELKAICLEYKWFFSGSTIWFDFGYVFAGLLIASTALLVFNFMWKKRIVDEEDRILRGESV